MKKIHDGVDRNWRQFIGHSTDGLFVERSALVGRARVVPTSQHAERKREDEFGTLCCSRPRQNLFPIYGSGACVLIYWVESLLIEFRLTSDQPNKQNRKGGTCSWPQPFSIHRWLSVSVVFIWWKNTKHSPNPTLFQQIFAKSTIKRASIQIKTRRKEE